MRQIFWSFIPFLIVSLTTSVFAAGTTPDISVSAENGAAAKVEQETSHFGLQLYSFFYGPSVGDPGSGTVPTTWTDQVTGVSLQNQIVGRYDLTENISISPAFDFEVLITDPNRVYGSQYVALSYDSSVKLSYDNLAWMSLGNNAGWLNADFRVYVPTSEYSRDNGTLGSMRFTLSPNFRVGNSGLSFALINFVRFWVQRQSAETNNKNAVLPRTMLYTGPLVSYQFNDRFSFWALGEASVTYDMQGTANTTQPNRSLVDFEPGLEYRVGEHVSVSPYLSWFIRQPLDTTSMNLTLSYSF